MNQKTKDASDPDPDHETEIHEMTDVRYSNGEPSCKVVITRGLVSSDPQLKLPNTVSITMPSFEPQPPQP